MPEPPEPLTTSSPLFWLSLGAALGIIFLGSRFLLAPKVAAESFGVPLNDGTGFAFAYAKGIRDIFSGVVALPFLLRGHRRAVAWIILTATMIPVFDGFIIIHFSGARPMFLSIHWGAAVYMAILAVFLFRTPRRNQGM